MFCEKCGAELNAGARFCKICGAQVGEASPALNSNYRTVGSKMTEMERICVILKRVWLAPGIAVRVATGLRLPLFGIVSLLVVNALSSVIFALNIIEFEMLFSLDLYLFLTEVLMGVVFLVLLLTDSVWIAMTAVMYRLCKGTVKLREILNSVGTTKLIVPIGLVIYIIESRNAWSYIPVLEFFIAFIPLILIVLFQYEGLSAICGRKKRSKCMYMFVLNSVVYICSWLAGIYIIRMV